MNYSYNYTKLKPIEGVIAIASLRLVYNMTLASKRIILIEHFLTLDATSGLASYYKPALTVKYSLHQA